jgi:hypothetical protein
MRRRLSLITLLTAWLLASGSQWDVVQALGWGRMIVRYSQSMTVVQAVRLTFTPDNLCGICESVSLAKQQPAASALPLTPDSWGKLILVFQPAAVVYAPLPVTAKLPPGEASPQGQGRAQPPVPPPRAAV